MRNAIAIILAVLVSAGCSAPRVSNTRLGPDDLQAMTDQMVESLLNSRAVAGRSADSDFWIITLDRVSNQTNDVLPLRERWVFMNRLRARLNESDAMRQRNLAFVLSAEAAEALNRRQREVWGRRAVPTHALAATFSALTQFGHTGRSDTYLCAFRLTELASDLLVWEDRYEVKRTVVRNKLD